MESPLLRFKLVRCLNYFKWLQWKNVNWFCSTLKLSQVAIWKIWFR